MEEKALQQKTPLDEIRKAVPVIIDNDMFRDGFALGSLDEWFTYWKNQSDSKYDFGGNSSGSSYLRISMSPYTPESEFFMVSRKKFRIPFRFGYGMSISQRIIGQEVEIGLVSCRGENDVESDVDVMSEYSPIAISGTVTISSNVATINTATAHGLKGGDRVLLMGNTENRLNVGAVVVTPITDKQFTVPCTLANGTYTAGGSIYPADVSAFAKNVLSMLYENATVTNASLISRRNGESFRTANQTVPTTVATQSNTNPYTDALNSAGDVTLVATLEQILYSGRNSDAFTAPVGSARYTQGLPDDDEWYRIRIRVKNLKNFANVVAKVLTLAKTGTTTATITTDRPHGLVTGQYVQIYGAKDQTNFPNLATAVACTVTDATHFTVVMGSATTTNTTGGVVSAWNGSVNLPGAINLSIQSIARTDNVLTVTMNSTSTGLIPGDYVELAGMDGSGATYDGTYKVLRQTGSVYELESIGANFGSIPCGGAVIKRTDVRINYVRELEHSQTVVELSSEQGLSDIAKALPVRPIAGALDTLTTLTTLTTVGTVTKAQLDAQAVVDIASAAITTTTTSSAVVMTNMQSCSFGVAVTATSGTTPTMDIVVQETIDGTNWTDIYHFERITGNGSWSSPLIPIKGQSIRYVRTVAGTTPSFTMSLTREQRQVSAPFCRRFIDRSVVNTTLNATTPTFISEGASLAVLVLNMGAITTTAPQFILEVSEDGTNFFEIGTALTGVANSTVQLKVDIYSAKYIRAKVKVAGSGSTLGYVAFKLM